MTPRTMRGPARRGPARTLLLAPWLLVLAACMSADGARPGVVATYGASVQAGGEGTDGRCADLRAFAREMLEDLPATGIVLAYADGETRCTAPAGVADMSSGTPVAAGTRFYAASTGKPIVAAAILDAVERGQLSLDGSIARHLDGLAGAARLGPQAGEVTIRQLLSHRSGLPEYLTDAFAEARPPSGSRWTPATALTFADPRDARAPGGRFDYVNTNYVLLGHILARLDGSLQASLDRRVFGPAGMRDSSVGASGGPLARGYEGRRDVSAAAWNSVLGDGAVVITAGDLMRLARTLFATDRILDPAMRAEMVRGASSYGLASYGLGIGADRDALGDYFGHEGSYEGYEADMRYHPESGIALAFLANAGDGADGLLDDMADWYVDR